jgi:hypothetical protein
VNKILQFFLLQLWLLVLSPYCCCLANAAVVVTLAVGRMMMLPRLCCCCLSNTFTNAAFGTTAYTYVFSAPTVTARVVALLLLPSCCGSFVVAVAVNNVAIATMLLLSLM